ncbi:MAG: NuoI/complex I 23 kDa subunit family protein [Rubrobacter sp.]
MPQVGQGILKGMSITLRNFFKPKITRQYPEFKRDLPERTRGLLTVDMDRCIACLQCMRVCPDHCISIDQTKRDADGSGKPKPFAVGFVIDDSRCMYCSLCVEVCPVNCIYHTEEFEVQAYNRLDLARQFGERPVDPTIDPTPPRRAKKPPAGEKGSAASGKAASKNSDGAATDAAKRPSKARAVKSDGSGEDAA